MAITCPICEGTNLAAGLLAQQVPTHAVKLISSRAVALAEPRGTIDLRLCRDCHFVFNAAFEPELLSYDSDYESTQTHSATYRAYARQMVDDLLQRLSGDGAIVDVGCGQGEFLADLGAASSRPLIGFDPAIDRARLQVRGARMVAEPFTAAAVEDPVALITCKMTLEHVDHPAALLSEIAALAARDRALVFLQLPNCRHIWDNTLFADVIYEHVNYFTRASLMAACQRAGLTAVDCWMSYGEQHLNLLAVADAAVPAADPRDGDDLAFTRFCERFAHKVGAARDSILTIRGQGGTPVIWGAGSKAVAFLAFTGLEQEIALSVDINPLKQGTFLPASGIEILTPDDDRLTGATDVFVMNPRYRDEIAATLAALGRHPRLHLID